MIDTEQTVTTRFLTSAEMFGRGYDDTYTEWAPVLDTDQVRITATRQVGLNHDPYATDIQSDPDLSIEVRASHQDSRGDSRWFVPKCADEWEHAARVIAAELAAQRIIRPDAWR